MGTASVMQDTASGHMAVRVLVALYTVASATGLIAGTNLSVLLSPIMPEFLARAIMCGLVASLCFFMLAGIKRRAMALLLAVLFLWSSYFAILGPNAGAISGSHWRDIILIGALLLIYADAANEEQNDISLLARVLKDPNTLNKPTKRKHDKTSQPPNMDVRRTSQTLFHNDLDELGGR